MIRPKETAALLWQLLDSFFHPHFHEFLFSFFLSFFLFSLKQNPQKGQKKEIMYSFLNPPLFFTPRKKF